MTWLHSSADATGGGGGQGAVSPILVCTEYVFGASRNDKTTGNKGKRNNNVQT